MNFALASSYIASGQASDAVNVLLKMPAGSDGNYRREMLLMGAYLEDGRAGDAEDLADQLIRDNPNDANVHALVGVLRVNLQQKLRARAHLNTALGIDSANVGALYALGGLAVDENDTEQATQVFGRLLDEQPTHFPALIQLANVYNATDSLAEFMPRLDAAINAAPGSALLQKLRSQIELMLGDTDAAMANVDSGRQAFPDDPGFMHLAGIGQLRSGDLEGAIDNFEHAMRLEPDNPAYQIDLARARLMNGEFAQAITVVRTYRTQRPADIRGLAIEVDAQLRSGDPASAKRVVTGYAEAYPDEAFVAMLFGDIELASGDAAGATVWYEEYAQSHWNRVVALRLAGAHQAAGTGQALQYIERWMTEDPGDSGMRRFYAQLLEESGRVPEAIREYERLEESKELDAIGLNNLAWRYMENGIGGASALAERAHRLLPDNGDITDTWGWILYKEGKIEQAVQTLRKAATQSPANPEIRYHLAAALSASGMGAEAREIVSELVVSDVDFPSRPEAEALLRSL